MSNLKPLACLIGSSGYVGSTLQKQTHFCAKYHRSNIKELDGRSYGAVICSAAPAQKWIANREPVADRLNIENLISHLKEVSCSTFVLISTVDVFKNPVGVDENTRVEEVGLHSYGLHRRLLEKFVESNFSNHLIVRLPGLVGPGLRKNVIYDLHHDNNLQTIDSRGVFQFYPMVNLWYDIQIALKERLKLVHLTAEPLSVAEVSNLCFNKPFVHALRSPPASYDMRTQYAALFGGVGNYQYSRRESLQSIRAYSQSESLEIRAEKGAAQ